MSTLAVNYLVTTMERDELLGLINDRITRGLSYGPDMRTSRELCLEDAGQLLSAICQEAANG